MNTISKIYFPIILTILLEYLKIINGDLDIIAQNYKKKQRKLVPYCHLRVISEDIIEILNYNDDNTKKHLRISSNSFRKIIELLPSKRHGWSNEYELIVFLFWMASGCSYRVAGVFIGMSKSTVNFIVQKMLDNFINKMRCMIKPPTIDEYDQIAEKFCKRAKTNIFKEAIGAIDGTHIRIACPVKKHDEYINYKQFYSIQCQAVVNSNHMFSDVFVGYPGSVHDTRVFRNSPLYKNGTFTPHNHYILGDSGYPCQLSPVAVITPFKNPTVVQKKFNTALSKARNIVECSFGLMKIRWRNIFNKSLELKISNSIKTVFVACILHNICVSGGDFGPADEVEALLNAEVEFLNDDDDEQIQFVSDSPDAILFRNNLLQNLINNH